MSVNEIAEKIKEAEKRNKKIAMFHFQSLINAKEFQGVDATQFCRDVGMRDSFATEFRKMISLARIMNEMGAKINKICVK